MVTERTHLVTLTPAACLPGCTIINFAHPGLEITTPGGNPGYLLQDGAPNEELTARLALLERMHDVRLIVDHPLRAVAQ